ncbi:MAG: hypothetical protein H0X12_03245 [Nocardioides sp.]|nr:hypothetical protein [Nocardioides sp.]
MSAADEPAGRWRRRLRRLVTLSAAVTGQLSQALISFSLQAVAARTLGASGLGTYALVYSVVITTSALSNGLVGDSLTVLDRGAGPVRAALQRWALLGVGAASVVTAVPLLSLGLLDLTSTGIYILASASFMLEGLLRRLLMSGLRFWAVVAVDFSGLVATVVTLVVAAAVGTITLDVMLLAMVAGQVLGGAVGVALLRPDERWWATGPADLRHVWGYGSWRAAQQLIRPTLLTLVRTLLVIEAGREAFGRLEAARIYVAPGLLVVQGLGSYLFASYARERTSALPVLVKRADRTAVVMTSLTLTLGVVATLLTHRLGPLISGPSFSIEPAAVLGWAVFAAATAANSPFSSLAAVRGQQREVVVNALVIALVTLVVATVVVLAGAPVATAPYVIGLGLLVQAVQLRNRVLRRGDGLH